MRRKLNMFISFSHKNASEATQLEAYLRQLSGMRGVDIWRDPRLLAGDLIEAEIERHLEDANFIVLLISEHYQKSNSCRKEKIFALDNSEQIRVIPVILDGCEWQHEKFSKFLVLPKDAHPLNIWPDQQVALQHVAREICRAVLKFRKDRKLLLEGSEQRHIEAYTALGTLIAETTDSQNQSQVNSPANRLLGLHHVSIPVRDLEVSKNFYKNILKLKETTGLEKRPCFLKRGAWFEIGNQQLHLVEYDEGTFRKKREIIPWDAHFAVEINDFGEVVRLLHKIGFRDTQDKNHSGYRMRVDPNINPGGLYLQLYILDPDNHIIELTQRTLFKKEMNREL